MSEKKPFEPMIEPVGFDQPKYTYKGMQIYTSDSIPENEIHMYDLVTGKITVLIVGEETELKNNSGKV